MGILDYAFQKLFPCASDELLSRIEHFDPMFDEDQARQDNSNSLRADGSEGRQAGSHVQAFLKSTGWKSKRL